LNSGRFINVILLVVWVCSKLLNGVSVVPMPSATVPLVTVIWDSTKDSVAKLNTLLIAVPVKEVSGSLEFTTVTCVVLVHGIAVVLVTVEASSLAAE
jgi:hypothetical protein